MSPGDNGQTWERIYWYLLCRGYRCPDVAKQFTMHSVDCTRKNYLVSKGNTTKVEKPGFEVSNIHTYIYEFVFGKEESLTSLKQTNKQNKRDQHGFT